MAARESGREFKFGRPHGIKAGRIKITLEYYVCKVLNIKICSEM